jgi:hypothetical protein
MRQLKSKILLSLLSLITIVSYPIFSGGIYPTYQLNEIKQNLIKDLKKKGFLLEPKSQIRFKLKPGEAVRYIVTPPFYLAKTAVGVAVEDKIQKIKILTYTLSSKDDLQGTLVDGREITKSSFLFTLEENAYFYMIEITVLESLDNDYGSVDFLYGFKTQQLIKESSLQREFYYNHSDEEGVYKDPNAKNKTPSPSDTGNTPCFNFDQFKNCVR